LVEKEKNRDHKNALPLPYGRPNQRFALAAPADYFILFIYFISCFIGVLDNFIKLLSLIQLVS